MRTCPTCGADREGAVRFCPSCGLDFWRDAAGQPAHALDAPADRLVGRGRPGALPFFVAGAVLLVVAVGATVALSGIVPPGMPLGRATPTPRALTPNEALIRAFFREVRDPNAEFRVTADATTTFTGVEPALPSITGSSAVRIHRDDWSGTQTAASDGETVLDIEMAVVDGIGHLREAGGDWVSGDIPERLWPVSPFRRISTVTEVDYVGTEMVDDRPLHTLVVTKWLGGRDYSDTLRRFARIASQESRFEIVVDSFGVPHSAVLTMAVVASDGSQTLTINAEVSYRFSDWDQTDPIIAPVESPAPS